MGIMNAAKGDGENLLHPRPTVGYAVYFMVAMALFAILYMVYKATLGKVVGTVGQTTGAALGSGSKVAESIFAYGDGT